MSVRQALIQPWRTNRPERRKNAPRSCEKHQVAWLCSPVLVCITVYSEDRIPNLINRKGKSQVTWWKELEIVVVAAVVISRQVMMTLVELIQRNIVLEYENGNSVSRVQRIIFRVLFRFIQRNTSIDILWFQTYNILEVSMSVLQVVCPRFLYHNVFIFYFTSSNPYTD